MVEYPQPEITTLTKPYWDGLEQGYLSFQRCGQCNHAWLPAREDCPNCLSPSPQREKASGEGRILSWVVYHTAYHDAFKDRLPYVVALVALKEGPQLISNFVGARETLRLDLPLTLTVQREGSVALARFKAAV